MKYKSWRTALCLSAFYLVDSGALADAQDLPPATSDGRYGTKCYDTREKPNDLCQISFYALLATPEKYHGKNIVLVGYLAEIDDRPVLFASKLSYESGVEGEGVTLLDAKLPPNLKTEMRKGAWPVFVVGTFDAKVSWDRRARLGAMRKIFNVGSWSRFDKIIIKPR